MKYFFFIFSLYLSGFVVEVQAQEFTYFNKKLEFPNNNLVAVATLPIPNGYLVLGNYNTSGTRAVFIARIDSKGDLIWISPLEDSLELGTGGGSATGACLVQIDETHFAVTYGIYKDVTFEDLDIALVKFTIEGDVLWQKEYGSDRQEQAYHLIHTKDDGFLMTGYQDVENKHWHFYAIKTDVEGKVEWEDKYSLGGHSVAFDAYETLDGGYIFSGYGRNTVKDYDMYFVKTNDTGKRQWQKNYGTDNADSGCRVVPLSDETYILSGGIEEDGIRKNYYAKLNNLGNIIWDRIYDLPFPDLFSIESNLIIKPDNGFIGVAVYENEYGTYQPIIMNFDSRGDTVWTKPITADPNASVYIRDIEKIEGGYVLAGHRFFPPPQYGWLLTIDEDGNTCSEERTYAEPDFEGCDSTVVFTDIVDFSVANPYQVRISPNPANIQTTIHYQIPKDGVLKIYDYQGRLIDNWELKMNNYRLGFEVESWASGVYLYSVEIEGKRWASGKLVVE